MEVSIVFMFLFAVVFGIFYLYFSTRNKERLALIEKGTDAEIFFSKKKHLKSVPFWKVLTLNLALVSIGVSFGILLGAILSHYFAYEGNWVNRPSNFVSSETLYTASIFLCVGISLFIGFLMSKNLDKK